MTIDRERVPAPVRDRAGQRPRLGAPSPLSRARPEPARFRKGKTVKPSHLSKRRLEDESITAWRESAKDQETNVDKELFRQGSVEIPEIFKRAAQVVAAFKVWPRQGYDHFQIAARYMPVLSVDPRKTAQTLREDRNRMADDLVKAYFILDTIGHMLGRKTTAIHELMSQLVNRRKFSRRPPLEPKTRRLTPRQTEVMQIVGECKGNFAEAGRRLSLDRTTVKQHYAAALEKMKAAGVRAPDRQLKKAVGPLPKGARGEVDIYENKDGAGRPGHELDRRRRSGKRAEDE